MATVDVARSKKQAATPLAVSVPQRRSRAFRYGSLLTLLALMAGTYLAPWIIGHTPLGPIAIRSALQLDGSVSIGSLALDWFSGVEVDDLEIRDADGQPALEIGALRTEKPLIGLLMDLADLGSVHVERVKVHLTAEDRDTNLERIFAGLLAKSNLAQPSIVLDVADGVIMVDDLTTKQQFRVEKVAASLTFSDAEDSLVFSASGELADPRQPGSFKLDVHTGGSARNGTALATGKIDCQANALPMELTDLVARRLVDGAQLGGRLTTRLSGAWGELAEGKEASLSGQTLIAGLTFSCRALAGDSVRVERVEIPCKLVQNGDKVEIQQLAAECELGSLNISGSAKMSDFSAADLLAALARENYEIDGRLDLAPLGQMLTRTLRLKQDTQITSGQVSLAVSGKQQESGMNWSGHVDASHLGATAGGRSLVWENPLAIDFAAHESTGGMILDRAECTSSFLQINAAGSIDDLSAKAKFDLAQLMSELRQFSDLDQLQLQGQAEAQLAWKRTTGEQFTAGATFTAQGFQLATADIRPWREETLAGRLDLKGKLNQQAVKSIETAQLTIEAATERLQLDLEEPITEASAGPCSVRCTWRGQLSHSAPRLEAALGITGWNLDGSGTVEADLKCSANSIDIGFVQADLAQLRAAGNGWFISEPSVAASLAGRFDTVERRLEIAQAKLTAGQSTAAIKQAVLARAAAGWTLDGATLDVEAQLADLYRWSHDARICARLASRGKADRPGRVEICRGCEHGAVRRQYRPDANRRGGAGRQCAHGGDVARRPCHAGSQRQLPDDCGKLAARQVAAGRVGAALRRQRHVTAGWPGE